MAMHHIVQARERWRSDFGLLSRPTAAADCAAYFRKTDPGTDILEAIGRLADRTAQRGQGGNR